jgi:methylthioribulose-1-phosphate dehydratase
LRVSGDSPAEYRQHADQLIRVGRRFDARGWLLGTSGNFSAVLSHDPLRLAITRSGSHKGLLVPDDIVEYGDGAVRSGDGRASAETLLHVQIAGARGAGAVLHTHSIWSTVLSDRFAPAGGLEITGYEMLKGLAGVTTHEHREWLPVLDNDQDMPRLACRVGEILASRPDCHGFLLRRHGMYTWGDTVNDAARHVEILEFLLEAVGRTKEMAEWRS